MNSVSDLQKLQALYDCGALTSEELTQAHNAMRQSTPQEQEQADNFTLRQQLVQLQHQNEISRVDREWRNEQQKYGRYTPTTFDSITDMLTGSACGLFWTGLTYSGHAPKDLTFIGILVIFLSLVNGVRGLYKAQKYKKAEARYQKSRSLLLSKAPTSPALNSSHATKREKGES